MTENLNKPQPSQLVEKKYKDMDRQWAGFEQILRTPPAPGESSIKLRDKNGPRGQIIIWSPEKEKWEFTGLQLRKITPSTKASQDDTSETKTWEYTWTSEKLQWWLSDDDSKNIK